MSMVLRVKIGAISLALLTVMTLAAEASAQTSEGSFERTFAVSGPVELEAETGSGRITVRAGNADRVHISGRIKAHRNWAGLRGGQDRIREVEANPPIVQSGNTIRIERLHDRDWWRNLSISYDVVVPATTRTRVETGSGSISVEGVSGPVRANTGSGSVEIVNIGQDVDASTGSGGIRLRSVQGRVQANTGSGSIEAWDVAGGFAAHTGSGGIRAELNESGPVDVSSSSGSIELAGVRGALQAEASSGSITIEGQPEGDWTVRSSSGSITVRLSAEAAFELYARTSSGGIKTDHPVTIRGSFEKNRLEGQVRGGGPRVDLRSSSGGIKIY